MPTSHRVLLIEDNDVDAAVFTRYVEQMEGWAVTRVSSLEQAEELVDAKGTSFWDLVAVDLTLPDAFDLEAVEFARRHVPQAVCVAVTARNPEEVDERALRAGAADLLVKGQMNARGVQRAVSHAVERNELVRRQLESEINLRRLLGAWTDAVFVIDDADRVIFRNDAANTLEESFTERVGDHLVLQIDIQPGDVLRRDVARRSGDPLPVEIRSWRVSWADVPARVVVLRDRGAERAAERAAAVAELGRGALKGVHDIGNRVSAMIGALGEARDLLDAPGGPRLDALRDKLASLQDSVEHVAQVVRDAREGAKAVRKRRIPVDMAALVRSCTENMRRQIEDVAALRLQLEPASEVLAEPSDLTRVVDNLLRNAVEALADGGGEDHEIRVSAGKQGEHVVLEVEDDGPGIPAEMIGRVFDEGVTGKADGTGLGLASVKRLVEAHEGSIEVASPPGRGACFRVRLPARVARHHDIRVLLLEDHEEVARANRRLLGERYHIETASDGHQALARIERDASWNVILCDLDMPGMDGRAFFEHLHAHHPDLAQRVVFCSGGATTLDMDAFLQSVGRPCLAKPLDQVEAIRMIEAVAEGGTALA